MPGSAQRYLESKDMKLQTKYLALVISTLVVVAIVLIFVFREHIAFAYRKSQLQSTDLQTKRRAYYKYRNTTDTRLLLFFIDGAHDEDYRVKFYSFEALGSIGTDEAIGELVKIVDEGPSLGCRERAALSLGRVTNICSRLQGLYANDPSRKFIEIEENLSPQGSQKAWQYSRNGKLIFKIQRTSQGSHICFMERVRYPFGH